MGVLPEKFVTERYQLKKYKTRQQLHDLRDYYNDQQLQADKNGRMRKDLKRCLRQPHIKLAEYLIELQYMTLEKYQTHTALIPGEVLPAVRTNNVQLAGHLGVSEKTIINLRKRLVAAKVISEEIWHGSNSGYEIVLSEEILWISRPGQNVNEMAFFGAHREKFSPYSNQLQVQDTNQLIQLSGDDFQLRVDNQPLKGAEPVDKLENLVENAPETVENPQLSSGEGTKQGTGAGYTTNIDQNLVTPPPFAARPPSLADALAPLSPDLRRSVSRHVAIIWTCVLNYLADQWDFLSDSQVEGAKAAIAEYFIQAQPDRYAAGATEICSRIALVARWLKEGEKTGKNRWIPLPAYYFDYRNQKNGFVKTKSWFKAHKQAQKDIQDRRLVSIAIKNYLNSLLPGAKTSPAEVYRQMSQRLGKRDKNLMHEFHRAIEENAGQSAQASA